MKIKRYAYVCLFLYSLNAFCAVPEAVVVPAGNDIRPEDYQRKESGSPGKNVVTNTELGRDPELAGKFLSQAVEDGAWDIVRSILPIYAGSANPDPVLISYAQGALAWSEKDYKRSIAIYRGILAANPQLVRIRLDLAKMLYENQQYDSAKYQFEKASADRLPLVVQENVQSYLQAIERIHDWSGTVDFSYLNDDNVNNASSGRYVDIGGKRFLRNPDSYPQKGHGFSYAGSAQRDLHLSDNHSLRLQGVVYGRSYWDNHKYDDILARSYVGYSYSDAKQRISLLPFYEKRWYGNDAYSSGFGVRTEYTRYFSSNWQLSNAIEYQGLHYDSARYRYQDGQSSLFSTTVGYAFSSRLALYGGADLGKQNTRLEADTNNLVGLRTGFEAEFPYRLSASFLIGILERKYADDDDIFSIRRKDREDNYLLSLWHRDFSVLGVMPKLNFSYKKVDSNIEYYSYEQFRVFLSATQAF
ncbi:DUF560 domain-containing protein [Pseudomonas sp. PDNC002]|uniref:porin family protein n=1 Tax=Pseudomonas sp. PDNC002 TaxID=2811422 RepID=UPI0019649500|nr:porin family protein [Pseudomonas sp. PDNC002]QRY80486.1 DUF560 domain-containing protein [Pseudomonas sp. PDNC002]